MRGGESGRGGGLQSPARVGEEEVEVEEETPASPFRKEKGDLLDAVCDILAECRRPGGLAPSGQGTSPGRRERRVRTYNDCNQESFFDESGDCKVVLVPSVSW